MSLGYVMHAGKTPLTLNQMSSRRDFIAVTSKTTVILAQILVNRFGIPVRNIGEPSDAADKDSFAQRHCDKCHVALRNLIEEVFAARIFSLAGRTRTGL